MLIEPPLSSFLADTRPAGVVSSRKGGKEVLMSRRLRRSSLAAGLMALLLAVSIPAEAAQVTCRIPFSFRVHGATLPPGLYHASTDLGQGLLAIRGHRSFAAAITNNLQSRDE